MGQVQAKIPPVGIARVFAVKPLLKIWHGLAQRLAASFLDRQDPGSALIAQCKAYHGPRGA